MKKTAVFYGSTTGNTEIIANTIAKKLDAEIFNVSSIEAKKIQEYDNIILGTSTWGVGDLQDDWESFITNLQEINLSEKNIALFGLGDSISFSETFVNGMGIIYQELSKKTCNIIGKTEIEGYDFGDSLAVIDNQFVGLAIDEDNQGDKTNHRIENWINSISPQLK